ncbi:MAG: electron transfer flavoprotein subunit alpha/FixB family protein [Mogibacterium sp.]|nr:electron transfer flavoprotein subunit alpha/FixB family protein [Mogibacterium sp.]MBR2540784.1 electron transfer flavoprotein subunit alpha/FixB family protein [Mogibacterium sp.]
MNRDIWVFAEKLGNSPAPVYYELVCKANEMKQKMPGSKVCGVVIGKDTDDMVRAASIRGVDAIYAMDHDRLDTLDACMLKIAFADMVRQYDPEVVLVGATALGSELAPATAGKLKTGLAAHCVDIEVTEERINCMVPAFGGRVISEIYVPNTRPVMASVRPGIFDAPAEHEADSAAEVICVDNSIMNDAVSPVAMVSFVEDAPTNDIKLEDAEIVVCAGRGVSTQEAFDKLRALADKLDAGIGYTRSFADTGLVPDESNMIGTSGKSVKPKVFLGFGISGAAHHVCGMNKSDLVITVNKDPKAKMFQFSDYGIVGDAAKMVCALLEKVEK